MSQGKAIDLTTLTPEEVRIARRAVSAYRYRLTEHGRKAQHAAYHRYMKTEKGRATRRRHKR